MQAWAKSFGLVGLCFMFAFGTGRSVFGSERDALLTQAYPGSLSTLEGCVSGLVDEGHAHYHCHDEFDDVTVIEFELVRPGVVAAPDNAHTLVVRGVDHEGQKQILDLSNGLIDSSDGLSDIAREQRRPRKGRHRIDPVKVRKALEPDRWLRGEAQFRQVTLRGAREGIHVKVNSPDNAIDLTLADNTTIYGTQEWDGLFSLVEDVTTEVNSAGALHVQHALLVGFPDGRLLLDRPARIVLDGTYGIPHVAEHAAAKKWDAVKRCPTDANEKTAGRLRFPQACYLRNGDSTIIWTHHLTAFGNPGDCPAVLPATGSTPAPLLVTECQQVLPSSEPYIFEHVNIVENGELRFIDNGSGDIDFRAKSILVERGGTLRAGELSDRFGAKGGHLSIGLWGDDPTSQGTQPGSGGIACRGMLIDPASDPQTGARDGNCYIPKGSTGSPVGKICDGSSAINPCTADPMPDHSLDNRMMEDWASGQLPVDGNHFGFKVLAVSYGGALELHGAKGVGSPVAGTTLDKNKSGAGAMCDSPANDLVSGEDPAVTHNDVQKWANYTGNSWARLDEQATDGSSITLDRPVTWAAGDKLVVATNDWHVGNSEVVTIKDSATATLTLNTDGTDPDHKELAHDHSGQIYTVAKADGSDNGQAEGRAAVGLLSRSITVRSLGPEPVAEFKDASACRIGDDGSLPAQDCYFGGHTIVRQGFASFRVSGVEFYQLGQGGRMAHYPVHFHIAKDTSYTDAYVRDSSIWDSMTRFVTLHATHGVDLSRNVGFLSLGHGFYLEEASEIDNLLCQNLGISARPSFKEYFSAQTEGRTQRAIPPILTRMYDWSLPGADSLYPSMFWIMNAYNDFTGNQAVGTGGFGVCYWPLSSSVSGVSRELSWASNDPLGRGGSYRQDSPLDYANFNVAGNKQAPFKRFEGNSCSTSAYAIMTERTSLTPKANLITGEPVKTSLNMPTNPAAPQDWGMTPMVNPYFGTTTSVDPVPCKSSDKPQTVCVPELANDSATMLPIVQSNFNATKHTINNDAVSVCSPATALLDLEEQHLETNAKYCVTSVLDRFTTRYNWAHNGFGAVWLRPWNYVLANSVIADQLHGGLGFVSGGSADQALPGYLAISINNLFVGNLESAPDAYIGPSMSGIDCNNFACPFPQDGTGLYPTAFNPKRLFTIYDGPVFSDGSTFANVKHWTCDILSNNRMENCGIYATMTNPMQKNGGDFGTGNDLLVADAGVGWKQPNGFYYPPAFGFRRTVFVDDATRHNVIDPAFGYYKGTPLGDAPQQALLKGAANTLLPSAGTWVETSVTPIDFTTILNDYDGGLNGVTSTVGSRTSGLSNNDFYATPGQAPECNSFGTNTVPHDFITTNIAKLKDDPVAATWTDNTWATPSQMPTVAMYRQLRIQSDPDEACDTPATGSICNGTAWGCKRGSFFMGTNTAQSPGLTINNGLYYLDTNPQDYQCATTSADAVRGQFDKDSYYAAFNLFSTQKSKTTFQIYVGAGVSLNDVRFIRVHPHVTNGTSWAVTPWTDNTPSPPRWANSEQTVLEIDLSTAGISAEYAFKENQMTSCQPTDICQINANMNGCTVNNDALKVPPWEETPSDNPLAKVLTRVCEDWVTHRESESSDGIYLGDCPRGGCPGVAFKMGTVAAGDTYDKVGEPLAKDYDTSTAPWNAKLFSVDSRCPVNDG